MDICAYSFEEYLNMVKSFHGNLAPGLIIGGFMVDLAMKNLPEGEFFDAISETPVCLPDAVQILTPCTFGNGWLSVVNFGRFAVTLYEKYTGKGIRVFLDTEKLNQWPEVRDWYFRKKKKSEQNKELLLAQISEAGYGLLSMQTVQVKLIRTSFLLAEVY
jgi:formylmethanofuran dehydrogenase subunit E